MKSHPDEIARQVKTLSNCFIDAAAGYGHQVLLEALINTYTAVGTSHDCCTQAAAIAAMTASLMLAQHAASLPQHPIH